MVVEVAELPLQKNHQNYYMQTRTESSHLPDKTPELVESRSFPLSFSFPFSFSFSLPFFLSSSFGEGFFGGS